MISRKTYFLLFTLILKPLSVTDLSDLQQRSILSENDSIIYGDAIEPHSRYPIC